MKVYDNKCEILGKKTRMRKKHLNTILPELPLFKEVHKTKLKELLMAFDADSLCPLVRAFKVAKYPVNEFGFLKTKEISIEFVSSFSFCGNVLELPLPTT